MYCRAMLTAANIALLVACQAGTDVGTDKRALPAVKLPTHADKPSSSADAPSHNNFITTSGASAMEKECGGARLQLMAEGPESSRSTSLHMTSPEGKTIEIAKPAEMSTYTAVGLGCMASEDKQPYFVVQYGELPYGCSFCEWYYLYDAQGKQLTRSEPLVLKDDSLPEGQAQSANNQDYEAVMRKFGLKHPELAYVQ